LGADTLVVVELVELWGQALVAEWVPEALLA
jgi:hypothetical protein